ncbi:MAG: DMT family transporter [Negativicutes bacterium]|nr:DMT family transporter [Negativicutes bacterium]
MKEAELNRPEPSLIYVHLELLVVVAIWAGTFVATKLLLMEVPPALSALYRYLLASVVIVAVDWRNGEKIQRQDYPAIIFLALTGVTLYYLLQHFGIRYTDATDAAILISLSPVFIGLISWILLGEKLRPLTVTGLALAFVGAVLVITGGRFDYAAMDQQVWGDILILLTAVSWAFYSVYGKKLLGRYQVNTIIKYTTVIGTIFILPFSLSEIADVKSFALSWVGVGCLLYLGPLASVYGYLAWYRALSRLAPVTVGSYLYFRPLLTGIIAALVLGEAIGAGVAVGGGLILLGTYLTVK